MSPPLRTPRRPAGALTVTGKSAASKLTGQLATQLIRQTMAALTSQVRLVHCQLNLSYCCAQPCTRSPGARASGLSRSARRLGRSLLERRAVGGGACHIPAAGKPVFHRYSVTALSWSLPRHEHRLVRGTTLHQGLQRRDRACSGGRPYNFTSLPACVLLTFLEVSPDDFDRFF